MPDYHNPGKGYKIAVRIIALQAFMGALQYRGGLVKYYVQNIS